MELLLKALISASLLVLMGCNSLSQTAEIQNARSESTKGANAIDIWITSNTQWDLNRFRSKGFAVLICPECMYNQIREKNPKAAEVYKVDSELSLLLSNSLNEHMKDQGFQLLSSDEIYQQRVSIRTFFILDVMAVEAPDPTAIDLLVEIQPCTLSADGFISYTLSHWASRFTMKREFFIYHNSLVSKRIVSSFNVEKKKGIETWSE